MFNTIKVNNVDTDYTHSIFDISEYNSEAIFKNLSAALAAVPQDKKKGGMTVKFIQQITLACYSVVKTENMTTEPSGTLLSEAPYIDSGIYDENQLNTIFSTLPSDTGAENALTYYVAVTVDETTTYTSWVITKVLNSDNKYVQYRLIDTSFTTDENKWVSEQVEIEDLQTKVDDLYGADEVSEETKSNSYGRIIQFTGYDFQAGDVIVVTLLSDGATNHNIQITKDTATGTLYGNIRNVGDSLTINLTESITLLYCYNNGAVTAWSCKMSLTRHTDGRVETLETQVGELDQDVTTLNEKVPQLETDVNNLEEKTEGIYSKVKLDSNNITSGYYRNSAGSIKTLSSFFYSNPIPVKVGTKFKANAVGSTGAQSTIAMLSWVNSDNTFVSLILNPSSAGTYEYTFEVDGYVCVSGAIGDLTKFTITTSVSEQIDTLNEKFDTFTEQTTQDISDLNSDVNSIKEKVVKTNSTNTTSGYYRNNAGSIKTLNGYFYSNPLKVIPGDTFKANNVSQYSAASTIAMLSWVKSDGTFISLILNPNSAGTYEYTFENEGYVCISGTTGDRSKYTITSLLSNRLEQLDTDVETFQSDVKDINDQLPSFLSFGGGTKLVKLSATNPIEKVRYDCGLLAIFKTIGVIGDSLASGEMQGYDANGNMVFEDMYEFSWGQQIAKMTGVDVFNFSQGGQYAKGWMTGNTARTWDAGDIAGGAHSNKKQCYFIGLAHNDKRMVENNTYTAGIGTVEDIDDSDYTQNADSYVGWYARIIQSIKSIEPRSYIFCITPPLSEYAAYSEQIRNIVEHFAGQRVYLIDIATYGNSGSQLMWMNSHLSAAGYLYFAYLIANYTDYLIRKNETDFKYTSLVGTNIQDTLPNS